MTSAAGPPRKRKRRRRMRMTGFNEVVFVEIEVVGGFI